MKFRTMSVAQSTVNRILNAAAEVDGMAPPAEPVAPAEPPAVPAADGSAIDAALQQPVAPVAGDPAIGQAVIMDGLGLEG